MFIQDLKNEREVARGKRSLLMTITAGLLVVIFVLTLLSIKVGYDIRHDIFGTSRSTERRANILEKVLKSYIIETGDSDLSHLGKDVDNLILKMQGSIFIEGKEYGPYIASSKEGKSIEDYYPFGEPKGGWKILVNHGTGDVKVLHSLKNSIEIVEDEDTLSKKTGENEELIKEYNDNLYKTGPIKIFPDLLIVLSLLWTAGTVFFLILACIKYNSISFKKIFWISFLTAFINIIGFIWVFVVYSNIFSYEVWMYYFDFYTLMFLILFLPFYIFFVSKKLKKLPISKKEKLTLNILNLTPVFYIFIIFALALKY